jgi:hypothetical protein
VTLIKAKNSGKLVQLKADIGEDLFWYKL